MPEKLDCQGLACPMPVLRVKEAIENGATDIEATVDNEAARENVSRFMEKQGFSVQVTEQGKNFIIHGTKDGGTAQPQGQTGEPKAEIDPEAISARTLVFITTDTLGRGDEDLGGKLMTNFVATLPELGENLWRIILLNGAVKLAATENPCLEALKKLEKSGVSILVCGTCLDHFNLLESKQVGETTNMLDVVTSLDMATKIIRP